MNSAEPEVHRVSYQEVEGGDNPLCLADLGSSISRNVKELIVKNTLKHGTAFQTGGVLDTSCLPVLGAGAGSAAASTVFAGNVFMATASPATLMAMKGGVGSAVMGPNGAIAMQAPFMASRAAILPVVGPVMLFMTLSSVMMSARFDRVQASLGNLEQEIREILRRDVAKDYGEMLGALARLQDISAEFDQTRRFTDEMKMRLVMVERDVSVVHSKYDLLVGESLSTETSVRLAPSDQHLYALSGIASVYVDHQRLRLALQDNPADVTRSEKELREKIDRTRTGFNMLLDQNPVDQRRKGLGRELKDMSKAEKLIRSRKKKDIERESETVRAISKDALAPVLNAMQRWKDSMHDFGDEGKEHSVVCFREDDGKGALKAYYTSDVRLEARDSEATADAGENKG